jgi:hypothetical protein
MVLGGALAAVACDEYAGGSDPPMPISSNPFGEGRTLASLINPELRSRPSPNQNILVSGVRVVHVDTFDETGQGRVGNVFLQDAGAEPGPYHAVLAFNPVYSPPSYRAIAGDVVDASGTFEEYFPAAAMVPGRFLPELVEPKLVARFDAVGGPLRPVVIPLSDLTKYETGRPWISTLVTLENVQILEVNIRPTGQRSNLRLNAGAGLPPSDLPTVNNELFDLANTGMTFEVGQTIKRVTGLVTLFGNFSVAPRSSADIEL